MHPEFLAQVAQAGRVGIFRRERIAGGNTIQFDDAPAAEFDRVKRGKDGRKIDAALAELDPFISAGVDAFLTSLKCMKRILRPYLRIAAAGSPPPCR